VNHSDTNDQTRVFDAHVHVDRGLDDYDLPKARKNIIFNEVPIAKPPIPHGCAAIE